MAQLIYIITCVPKFDTNSSKQSLIFKGTLEDILYKFGAKNSNPLEGFIHKGNHFIYKFSVWNGTGWSETSDPRPQTLN